jgi:hypothetical protein
VGAYRKQAHKTLLGKLDIKRLLLRYRRVWDTSLRNRRSIRMFLINNLRSYFAFN